MYPVLEMETFNVLGSPRDRLAWVPIKSQELDDDLHLPHFRSNHSLVATVFPSTVPPQAMTDDILAAAKFH